MDRRAKRLAIGTLFAGIAGYVVGILTAPKSGRETRATIQTAVSHGFRESEKELKSVHTELNELLEEAKDSGGKAKGRVGREYENIMGTAQQAKLKVREMLSAIHEGDAEDKDLQKALNEARKAIKHIKTYLRK